MHPSPSQKNDVTITTNKSPQNNDNRSSLCLSDISRDSFHALRSPLTRQIVKVTVLTCLGGILSGYHLAVIGPALPSLTNTLHLSSTQSSTITGVIFLGGTLGCILGGTLCDSFGRKRSILLVDILFSLGSVLLSMSNSFGGIVFGRIVTGFAVCYSTIANVSYLTEMAPSNHRGGIVSANELSLCLGMLISYIVGYTVTKEREPMDENERTEMTEWRIMFACPVLLAVIQFYGMTTLPESDAWMEMKRRDSHNAYGEVEHRSGDCDIVGRGHDEKEEDDASVMRRYSFARNELQFFLKQSETKSYFKRAIVIAMVLAMAQQFCGHVNVLNFAPEIFQNVIGTEQKSIVLIPNLFLGCMKFVVTTWVIWEVDNGLGRRFLLLLGISIVLTSLFLLMIAFRDGGSTTTEEYSLTKTQKVLAVMGTSGVVIGYAISYGPLTWLITSELFPASVRGRALGATSMVSMICAYFVSYSFLNVQERFGPNIPYVFYFLSTLCALLFTTLAIPDTGSTAIEQEQEEDEINMKLLETRMDNMWWWRTTQKNDRKNSYLCGADVNQCLDERNKERRSSAASWVSAISWRNGIV